MEKLEDLGFDGLSYDRVIEAINKPYGVILSTGPTGSGKTTTLYSILSRLNRPEVNIITLEDPVEYELPGINQVQVKPQIGFGFADGLRSVLRQDPNIIMVGEIRDSETAELVTHAALTGHLVLSTLHTNDAAGALPRLYNLGVEPFLLTSAINAIIGQRLVRRVCQKCRTEINVPQSVLFEVKKELEKLNLNMPIKFFKGKGCSDCKNGFSGRIGIFEVLNMTPEIEDLVLTKKTSQDIFDQAIKSGMITMRQDGFIKAIKGLTTVDEVLRVTSETKEE
jgi:type II secretory ATPase GspE/PulE/Tfp pilus assembly ATPase PilB-like protein